MEPQIPVDIKKIEAFCDKWQVNEFYLFGSVLREDFNMNSDVDVCVTFADCAPWDLLHIVEMIDELERIFGRKVDLLETKAIRNPFRLKEIMSTRRLIHAT